MHRFFSSVVEPCLDAAQPAVVVEIGSDHGNGTALLASWCADNDAMLHCIDPLPKYDPAEWQRRWPSAITFHLSLSLEALADLGPADVVCIDGDHNWYTVFHELELLARSADAADRPFPLTFLHDVAWPYGRRDLYYDPATVPEEHRQPYRKGGIAPGERELLETGFNDHLDNAVLEGTPRNGVLTAVEDFVKQHERLRLEVVPGLHGLGIIYDERSPAAVLEVLAEVMSDAGLRRVVDAVENDRLARLQRISMLERRVKDQLTHIEKVAEQRQRADDVSNRRAVRLVRLESQIETMNEVATRLQRTTEERLGALTEALEGEKAATADLRRRLGQAEGDYRRLRQRRSVRASLWVAGLTQPVFRWRRR